MSGGNGGPARLGTALSASGVVCLVGAGGKKTTLYRLADALERAVVTATVRIPRFDDEVARLTVTEDPASALADDDEWPLGLVPERERTDSGFERYRGYDPTVVDRLADAADGAAVDAVLVKADGARSRLLKAPDEREPQLPASADTVVPVASARVVGKPLTEEHVHRPDRVAALTGLERGERIGADDVATVLASGDGGLKGVPDDAQAVPLVNMVDDEALEATARAVAAGVLDRASVERVVLSRMNAPDPVVAVVE
ncbi:selenium cofactor biosynthesis protein YqeC [Halomicrococcus gelatinilyticus]|uniref:selenium cofactor biosynthesis protein YqeC n=1 Tax=Halomicrococcus gelatinilyticus TaxID=1702103 RepID=UPI002E0F2351